MQKMSLFLIVLCMFLVPRPGAANEFGAVRLSLTEGDVQVLIKDSTDWTPAAVNLPFHENDRIWIAESGRAELQIPGGVYARAAGSTSLDILTVNRESAQFYLGHGHLYVHNRRGGITMVQVDTSGASIRSYDNSIVLIDAAEDGVNEISVLRGEVYAESRAGITRVSAGSTLTLRGGSTAEISPIGSPDEWERWNMKRDRELLAWSESSRYLPEELQEYSSDFDRYGRWDHVSEYGYVWFPSVTAAAWAPYSYGRWIWIRDSYVWIDYHPWGWAPSHYGRWVFLSSRGWCWVPPAAGAVYWGPGYVGWIFTPSYVAWVPLAPGETYYGYGYYGPWSVNVTTVNINTIAVSRSYRNAAMRNSVVVVRRDTFGTGRRVPVRIRENPFTSRESVGRNIDIAPPRKRPGRAIVLMPPEVRRQHRNTVRQERMSRIRPEGGAPQPSRPKTETERIQRKGRPPVRAVAPVPQPRRQQLPPEQVRRRAPEQMKSERPLVRQREGSVFRQQAPDGLSVRRSDQPRTIERHFSTACPSSSQQQTGVVRKRPARSENQEPQSQGNQRHPQKRAPRRAR